MSLFNQLGNQQQQFNNIPDKNQMANLVNQLRANPVEFLSQMGYNIPSNLNDPNAILSHLMQSRQVNGGLLSQAQKLLSLFK